MEKQQQFMTTRVVVADDHAVVRTSIRNLLKKAPNIEVVGEARNGFEALELVEKLAPDVLLLDMEMPGLKGVEVARRLRAKQSPVRILALSAYDDKEYVLGLLASGASGYLLKGESPRTIIEAVLGVARGEQNWISRRLARQVVDWSQAEQPALPELTDQEIAILKLLVIGYTDQQIGRTLKISEEKVQQQLKIILQKLNASTRIELAMRAVQDELI